VNFLGSFAGNAAGPEHHNILQVKQDTIIAAGVPFRVGSLSHDVRAGRAKGVGASGLVPGPVERRRAGLGLLSLVILHLGEAAGADRDQFVSNAVISLWGASWPSHSSGSGYDANATSPSHSYGCMPSQFVRVQPCGWRWPTW